MDFLNFFDDGVEIFIRATANSKNDLIDGFETRDDGKTYLKVKVRAIADDNKANDAIIKIIAKKLNVTKSEIKIVFGNKSRIKCLLVKSINLDKSAIIEKLLLK